VGIRCAYHVRPLYPQKLALTSPTGGGRSFGIVRSRTRATEFNLVLVGFYTWDWSNSTRESNSVRWEAVERLRASDKTIRFAVRLHISGKRQSTVSFHDEYVMRGTYACRGRALSNSSPDY